MHELVNITMQTGLSSLDTMKAKTLEFEERFKMLKRSTQKCLEERHPSVSVKQVVLCLTEIPENEKPDHKVFLESSLHTLCQAEDLTVLFAKLNLHWTYLSFYLLNHLIIEFKVTAVQEDMEKYKCDLKKFRKEAPLNVFFQAHKRRHVEPPSGFVEVVTQFEWPEDTNLETVENFRQEYASHYGLHECAMILGRILFGSVIVTWFISLSFVEHLKASLPDGIFVKYNVEKLEVDGVCVYKKAKSHQVKIS